MKDTDPTGKNQHAPGAKLDNGKPRCSLVLGEFARALWQVSLVGTFGANKYSDNGWLYVENGMQRYEDAQLRHWLLTHMGEEYDSESELLHLAHEAWNALARLEKYCRDADSSERLERTSKLIKEQLTNPDT